VEKNLRRQVDDDHYRSVTLFLGCLRRTVRADRFGTARGAWSGQAKGGALGHAQKQGCRSGFRTVELLSTSPATQRFRFVLNLC